MSDSAPKITDLSPHLFWDLDTEALDINGSKQTIIERAIVYGLMSDWNWLRDVYGLEIIRSTTLELKNLDNISLSFLSNLFNIPKEHFACYTRNQLNLNFLNY